MLKLEMREIIGMMESIDELMKLELPVAQSYKVIKNIKKIKEEHASYEVARHDLVRKHGERVESENIVRVKNENMEQFGKELEEILSRSIELDIEPISVSILGEHRMKAKDIAILGVFFCD
jgi:hypothetical protein